MFAVQSNDKKLPLVHRLSPCSPLGGVPRSEDKLSTVMHRDGLRLRALYEAHSGAASTSGEKIPTSGNADKEFPGNLDYTVVLGYGTPAQQFTVNIETAFGTSLLRCKPCKVGDGPCDPAFYPSWSSSFATVPCGSPECPGNCSGQTCAFRLGNDHITEASGTYVKDTLTLSPSTTVESFTFGCMEAVDPDLFYGLAGVIDLSRNNRSLASRVSSSPSDDSAVAFSYCLPSNISSHGFLSIGAARSEYAGRQDVQYAPLVDNTVLPTFYFVELVGLNVGGRDLIPPTAPIANFTLLDAGTIFTYFTPSVYAVLRKEFQRLMADYPPAPAFDLLDTCYNFTGLNVIKIPIVRLKFAGGSFLQLEVERMMYFTDPTNYFSVACLAFGASDARNEFPISVIGNLAQRSMEMIYDVKGGKVGFTQGIMHCSDRVLLWVFLVLSAVCVT